MLYKGLNLEEFKKNTTAIRGVPPERIHINGKKQGSLKIICRAPDGKRNRILYWCECACGKITKMNKTSLRRGSKSCVKCSGQKLSKGLVKIYKGMPLSYWDHTRKRAFKRKIVFKLTKKQVWDLYLQQKKKCALSGQHIDFCTGNSVNERGWKGRLLHTASLDRIDPNKGYIPGNIQWVHKDINRMKNNFDEKYFINTCKLISKIRNKK